MLSSQKHGGGNLGMPSASQLHVRKLHRFADGLAQEFPLGTQSVVVPSDPFMSVLMLPMSADLGSVRAGHGDEILALTAALILCQGGFMARDRRFIGADRRRMVFQGLSMLTQGLLNLRQFVDHLHQLGLPLGDLVPPEGVLSHRLAMALVQVGVQIGAHGVVLFCRKRRIHPGLLQTVCA